MKTSWAVDSGATHHFCNDLVYFVPDSMVKVDICHGVGRDINVQCVLIKEKIIIVDHYTLAVRNRR
jgi:hypothetical protein